MIKVAAAILVKDGRILIAKRLPSDKLANKWEFPGGKLKPGESPEECLRREMQEEFQVEVSVERFFCDSRYRYEHADIYLMAYIARLIKGELVPTCHAEYRWVTVDELVKYDFAPADKPVVAKLRAERVIL
ncbi:MAG TPA: (deoxy)nucleoside triphosphate pyrophosphohydrolase [Syntrophomonadaceae bacterium]|jgi:8-oxo-dGTP diphosphatase|nr:(deoxy)nucleoside triphosphate pyrophosphohydrolase [Thermoanaerobacterales bacterium]HHW29884.1 (deoxy)nucleoside triphosphate pyrophosphohydrolase [Syntrophomonadaceae bacterium]